MTTTVINLSSLDGSNGFRLEGESANDSSGLSVSSAGDINSDGFDDVIVGAFSADPNGESSGSSYVIFGKASGFDASLNLSDLDGGNGFRMDGISAFDRLGFSVSDAGDVNGDGFDDLIVGTPGAEGNNGDNNYYGFDGGSSYVVFGKSSGFSSKFDLSKLGGTNGFRVDGSGDNNTGRSVSNAGDVNGDGFDDLIIGAHLAGTNYTGASYIVFGKKSGFDAALNLSDLNGTNGFSFWGESEYDRLGGSVSSAGDVNGDGFDDVIVGAVSFNPYNNLSGTSYIVFGKASGFDATLNLSSLNGVNGFSLNGVKTYDESGSSVSSAGDVNGDGFDDVIIGATGADPNGEHSGSTYVVFGKASGFEAIMNLSSLDGTNGFRIDGEAESDRSGGSVSSAGDVNGDGFDDVIIGATDADATGSNAGSSYIVFGKASGFDPTLELASLESTEGLRLDGVIEGDFSGLSVSSAGDINGDDFDDVIVGAFGADVNGDSSGSSYIVFGRSSFTDGNIITGTSGDDQLKGTSAAEHFKAGDGNDRMIGRGGADEFHGEAGDDYIQVLDLGFGRVDGGSGNDVLHTDGKDLNLDLTDYLDKIQGIETICLYGRGDNTLTLIGAELQDLSDTTNTLKVHGNAGDRVVLEGNWVDGGSHGFYHTYTQDDAVLLVGMNMTAVVG